MIKDNYVIEPEKKIPVCFETDVLVVGAGPGGHAAAVAAARAGADVVLLERYGHLGGMATGGLVTMIHSMSDGTNNIVIRGQCEEWLERLRKWDALDVPDYDQIGTEYKTVGRGRFNGPFFRTEGKLIYGARTDSEILKVVLNDMAEEAGVKVLLHALVTDVIIENGKLKGVIFESKSGRQAVLAKTIIDGSGDGDVFARAGCDFASTLDAPNRLANPALCIEFGNVDWDRNEAYRASHEKEYEELMKRLEEIDGFRMHFRTIWLRESVCHFNMFLKGYDVLKVEDLTRLEFDVRRRMMTTYEFYRENIPGFEDCFIMITAPQVGVRGSRILEGRHKLTETEARAGTKFEDTVCEFPPLRGNYPENPHVFIPFSCLMTKEFDNLLVAGRTFSSDEVVNEHFNTISHCIMMGQATGTAGALAAKSGVAAVDIDTAEIRKTLIKDGVLFPGFD